MTDHRTRSLERAAAAGDAEAAEALIVSAMREGRWGDVALAAIGMGTLDRVEAEAVARAANNLRHEFWRGDMQAKVDGLYAKWSDRIPGWITGLSEGEGADALLLVIRKGGRVGHIVTTDGKFHCTRDPVDLEAGVRFSVSGWRGGHMAVCKACDGAHFAVVHAVTRKDPAA